MKQIFTSLMALLVCLSFITSCEKQTPQEEVPVEKPDVSNNDITSIVEDLKKEVFKLNEDVIALQKENENLHEEIKQIQATSPVDYFEVDGLYFSMDGNIISPLKKVTTLSLSDGYGQPAVGLYEYDEYGRIKSRTSYYNNKKEYTETFVYEGRTLTRHYAYRQPPTSHEFTGVYEY